MSESTTMTAEPMEAVIISGPRKGEIVTLTNGTIDINDEIWTILNEVLDGLSAAIEQVRDSVRSFRESLHEREEAA
jgi:hypothetical protein